MTDKKEKKLSIFASMSKHDRSFKHLLKNTEEDFTIGWIRFEFLFDILEHGEKKGIQFI